MIKKVTTVLGISFLCLGALFFCTDRNMVLAADTMMSPAAYKTSVSRISLSKPLYNQGENISGTFNLVNSGSENVSDIYYRVLIVGGYDKNGVAQVTYSQSDYQGPLSIGGSVTVPVSFSYKLPPYVGGNDIGVKIEELTKQGQLLYWTASRFNVSGSMSAMNVTGSSIEIGGKFYVPQTGPTIHEGELPSIVIDLTNPLATEVTLTPKIKIYNRVTTGNTLYTSTTTTSFTISAKGKKSVSYPLPLFDNKAGVYAGTIDFVDSTGVSRSPTMDFRYIVAGDIATIQSVDTGSGTVAKGQTVNVSVLYSGSPTDIRTLQSTNVGSSTLAVSLFNEKGNLIGKNTVSVDTRDIQTEVVGVVATASSRALRADVVLSKDGKVLSNFSTSFVPALNSLPAETAPDNSMTKTIIFVVGVIFLGLIILFILRRNKKIPPAALIAIALIIVGVSFSMITRVSVSHALDLPPMPVPVDDYVQVSGAPAINGPSHLFIGENGVFSVVLGTPPTVPIRYQLDSSMTSTGISFGTGTWMPDDNTYGTTGQDFLLSFKSPARDVYIGVRAKYKDGTISPIQKFHIYLEEQTIPKDGTWTGPGGWVLTDYNSSYGLNPSSVTLSVLPSASGLLTGQSFSLNFTAVAMQCSNASQTVSVYTKSMSQINPLDGTLLAWSLPEPYQMKQTYSVKNGAAYNCVGHCYGFTSSNISIPLIAPFRVGRYRIFFKVRDNYNPSAVPSVDGYVDITVVSHPIVLTGSTGSCSTTPQTSLAWGADLTASSYRVHRSNLAAPDEPRVTKAYFFTPVLNSGSISFIDSEGLTAGKSYDYQVTQATPVTSDNPSNHVIVVASGPCDVESIPDFMCTNQPLNANICLGDDMNLESNTSSTVVNSCTSTKCEYMCNSGYVKSGTVCVIDPSVLSCTGTTPANANLCSGDGTGLTLDTVRTTVDIGQCSTAKCQYECVAGFVKSGNTCIAQTSTGGSLSCKAQVKNASGVLVDASSANIGQEVTWTAVGTGTYLWSGNGVTGTQSKTGSTYKVRYSTIGNKTMFLNNVLCTTSLNGVSRDYLPLVNNPNFHEF